MKKVKLIITLIMLAHAASEIKSQTNFIFGKQIGTNKEESTPNPVTDKFGNVYVSGTTNGVVSGINYGKSDGFITKLDSNGNTVWTKQFGTIEDDKVNWLAIDQKGNLFIAGTTKGVLDVKNFGNEDIFIVNIDTLGNIYWQKQYGTDSTDIANAIYVDNHGDIYVSGATKGLFGDSSFGMSDCFLLKLDKAGNKIFTRQFGTNNYDDCLGVSGDSLSGIYLCGNTLGDFATKNKGKVDAFLVKFSSDGEEIKRVQFGAESYDLAKVIAIDNNKNIYLGCFTCSDYNGKNQGEGDNLLIKFDEKFEIVWSQQFGTTKWDGINGIAFNDLVSENIVISGCQNWPSCQSFCRVYNKNGNLLWAENFTASGKNGGTCGKGLCLDNNGYIYHVGDTAGNLFNTAQGEHDVFILKLQLDKSLTK